MNSQPKLEILFRRGEIETTVKRLATEISRDYRGKQPIMVGILKGSFVFMADLMRAMDCSLEVEFVRLSSYGKRRETSGRVRVVHGLRCPVKDKDILVVEDIVDSGLTVSFFLDYLRRRNPASVKLCVLLDKQACHKVEVPIDYLGFTIPDRFIVGCGIDFGEKYRNLPDLYTMEFEE